jgi:N-acetylglucosamine kinase-like BadF-type ATPase
VRVYAGLTGFSEGGAALRVLIADALGVATDAITLVSDIEIAYLHAYAPGEGYLVYAGTGSIAAFIDSAGNLHRAGGRGVLLDDAGGGFWIAREALRHIWRTEDEHPESWRRSPMAREIFARIGGSDWAQTRQFMYGASNEVVRGEIGKLAMAVAAIAEIDPVARGILVAAGGELARLARAMSLRFGPRPITLSGRVAQLHPAIADAMRAALPQSTHLQVTSSEAHCAAARIAARGTVAAR